MNPERNPFQGPPYYDPYGGLPRREDLDEFDTAVPRPLCPYDHNPTHMTFRDIVLSMQSMNAQFPPASETSVKRWARRALDHEKRYEAATAIPPLDPAPLIPQKSLMPTIPLKKGKQRRGRRQGPAQPCTVHVYGHISPGTSAGGGACGGEAGAAGSGGIAPHQHPSGTTAATAATPTAATLPLKPEDMQRPYGV